MTMTDKPRTEKTRLSRTSSPSAQPSATEAAATLRILALVDGSETANRVVDFLTSLAAAGNEIEAVVLNVQEQRHDRLRGYDNFKRPEIEDRLKREVAMPIADGVSRRLGKSGIRSEIRIEFGEPVETALRCAQEEHCDMLVIGQKPPGAFMRFLARYMHIAAGSIAASLAVLSRIPVVIAK